ncbi:unnamed protein product [Cylindrotheca closterium]|uniref:FAD-binding FR-type domain-containing protein n=1 Tax=Cylindrotheca closterium TaxID=2856 RepID=A0AAD2FSQ5_9STRA|nr:unnamed protein product [Cylindrotheca closterium]
MLTNDHISTFQHQHILQTHTWPFHQGELQVQLKLGAYEYVNSYAPKIIRPFMPEQHREFYKSQPFLVAAARDENGKLWSTLLFASTQSPSNHRPFFVQSPDSKTLLLATTPLPGDALEGSLQVGSDLGLLGIEFATRRRNRVNGRIISNGNNDNGGKNNHQITFSVDQSFGNCPQYIKPRNRWSTRSDNTNNNNVCPEPSAPVTSTKEGRPNRLSPEQLEKVRQAETISLATGYRGHGANPVYGNDASHRGGSAGFLHVREDARTIILPDYNGNHHFNTIGNLILDSSMGITIPLYEKGEMIQLTGQATIIWDDNHELIAQHVGAKRLIQFVIDQVVELQEGSFPLRWDTSQQDQRMTLQVKRRVKESDTVASFYLSSVPGESPKLASFQAGQHLPVTIETPKGSLERSYSLSNYDPNGGEYRISVQREPMGQASTFLHDSIKVGSLIQASKPAGGFVYPSSSEDTTFIFLSAGIGVTPVLSMLHAFAADKSRKQSSALWIHSAKDSDHHPFTDEVKLLQSKVLASDDSKSMKSIVTYTREEQSIIAQDDNDENMDNDRRTIYHTGRLQETLLKDHITPALLGTKNAQAFLCGPTNFVVDMEGILINLGIDASKIQHESF